MLVDSAKQMQPDLYSTRPQGDLMSSYQERELTLRDLVQMFRRRRVDRIRDNWCNFCAGNFVVRLQYTPLPGNGNDPGAKGKF